MTKPSVTTGKQKWQDIVWWLLTITALLCGIWGNYHYDRIDVIWRAFAWLVGAPLLGLLLLRTSQGARLRMLGKQAWHELLQVVWPTRQETIRVTMFVIAIVFATALLLWGIDTVLMWLMGWITGQRG